MRSNRSGSENRNYVWVRLDLVEAIWNNNGTLPKGWKPSRKRGRGDSATSPSSWGWTRAFVVQSTAGIYSTPSPTAASSPSRRPTIRERRRRDLDKHNNTSHNAPDAPRTVVVTLTVDDEEFAPRHLQRATVSLSYDLNDHDTVCNANTWWMRDDALPPEDLTTLTHLHEPAVVYCLLQRYQEDLIYTYTGKILLALNPFRALNGLYGERVMEQYWHQTNEQKVERPPPHIYAIAQDAYRSMMQMSENQSILVSGESGSGKTVTTKIIMGYLASQSQRLLARTQQQQLQGDDDTSRTSSSKAGVESQILESNPVLESFGNARTIRNDNSSRFGKFMELLFLPTGCLVSASIETYLLEKVRLISQSPGERNYHVFYELLAGVSQKERMDLHIANVTARDFRMTALSGTFDRRDGVDDRDTYRDLRSALDTVGFSRDEQHDLISVCCALLHTSNLTFRATSDSTTDASELVSSNPSLRSAIVLLGVPVEALNNALCLCAIEARGEVFHKNMSISQAEQAVEALIKATYAAMFTHIVRRVNISIAADNRPLHVPSDRLARIGVLDIFGFESFERNSFEQLCINYCNEALQQQFNKFIFKLEQKEYEEEGIEWSFITFPDNQEILDLIERRRDGILSILDEQCRLGTCTDATFCNAVFDKCHEHPRFSMTKTQKVNLQFSINHYAGLVTYDAVGFREKNKDDLPKETTELLISSSLPFFANLGEILSGQSSPPDSPSNSPTNRSILLSPSNTSATSTNSNRSPVYAQTNALSPVNTNNKRHRGSKSLLRESVGSQFSLQLRELRDRIDCTTPHYVRCLKPNDDLVPGQFETHIIADQLRCAGVLEAIRVSRVGFPHRFTHYHFLERYGMLATHPSASGRQQTRKNGKERCILLMKSLFPRILELLEYEADTKDARRSTVSLGMQMGHTKVFLRRQVFEALEILRTIKLDKAATILQSSVRRFQAQFNFLEALIATILIQCFARRLIARRKFIELKTYDSAVTIQKNWRRFCAETSLMGARLIARFCQAYYRGSVSRELYAILRVELYARAIQVCWRRHRLESWFQRLRKSTIMTQCLWRQKVAIAEVKRMRREARELGNVAAERDRFKQESIRLRQEIERLKRSNTQEVLDAPNDDEVERLRSEVQRLQKALNESDKGRTVEFAHTAPTTASTATSPSWISGVFGKKGDGSSQASSGSFSPLPVIQRVIYGKNCGPVDSPARRKKAIEEDVMTPTRSIDFFPGISSTSMSLLDAAEGGSNETEFVSQPFRSSPVRVASSKPYDITDQLGLDPLPAAERRGPEFGDELKHLHDSVFADDVQSVGKILSHSVEPHLLVNEAGADGRTALHVAVQSSNVKMAKVLIRNGAIVNTQDFDGETPLHHSIGAPMTTLLLEDGKGHPNIPNIDGICSLHLGVRRRDVGSVRALLQHRANVNAADNIRWFTPLHLIALPEPEMDDRGDDERSRARVMIANLLCGESNSPHPDLNYQDNEGNSPLHYAVQVETPDARDLINTFLDKGADPCLDNSRQQNPLLLLCHNDFLRKLDVYQECLHSMLFRGADPNRQSSTGCTPLHLSLYHHDIDSAVQLVNSGAELHLLWKKPKRWVAFWDDNGSHEILALDMVQDEHSLHRILAAIVRQPKFAPLNSWCMHCKSQLGAFARAVHCRHCGRNVCGACTRRTLSPDYFPKTFEIYEASWVCLVCERILVARKEDDSGITDPTSSDDERF